MDEPQPISVKTSAGIPPPQPKSPVSPVLDWLKRNALNLAGFTALFVAIGLMWWNHHANPGPAPAPAPLISLPAQAKTMVGKHVCLNAITAGKHVRWLVSGPQSDVDLLKTAETTVHFVAALPGDYRVTAETVINEAITDPAICMVHVTAYSPPPCPGPGPSPGPGPAPPPAPIDPFVAALQAAYAADADSGKATKLDFYHAILAEGPGLTNDASLTTIQQLLDVLHAATQIKIGADLAGVRQVVNAELAKNLPAKNGPLAPVKEQVKTQLQRAADAVGKVR